jgi:FMN phosphatase YigB (HAD superfamily)
MNYEAIFIDWDGTLSDSRFWERWKDDPGYSDKYDKIQSALFQSAIGKLMLTDWMTGDRDYRDILTYLTKFAGMNYEELESELHYGAENMKLIDEGVLSKIQHLRDTGKQVVIATDNMDVFSKWTVPALKLNDYFDDILNSSSIRVLKSEISPKYSRSMFFHRYLTDMNIAPKDTVLIDNSLDAKQLEASGINFLHVTDDQPLSHHLDAISTAE